MIWPWQRRRLRREQAAQARLAQAVIQLTDLAMPKGPRVVCIWPDVIALSPTQRYAWCRCGLSANGLWCDGSHNKAHQGAGHAGDGPLIFSPKRAQHYWLCTCKQTRTPPYCDASHHRLQPPNQ
ncbi:MAG: CDGSH iron-sulfur domain-containing protein [Paraperlucidibaca sp.]